VHVIFNQCNGFFVFFLHRELQSWNLEVVTATLETGRQLTASLENTIKEIESIVGNFICFWNFSINKILLCLVFVKIWCTIFYKILEPLESVRTNL